MPHELSTIAVLVAVDVKPPSVGPVQAVATASNRQGRTADYGIVMSDAVTVSGQTGRNNRHRPENQPRRIRVAAQNNMP